MTRGPKGERPRGARTEPPRGRPGPSPSPYLPADAASSLARWIREGMPLHPGLLAQRFVAARGTAWPSEVDGRETYARVVALGGKAMREAVRTFGERARALARALRAQGMSVEERVVRVGWRLTIGLGGEHPAEVGFTLHRAGFPYLPASGLKGLAREVAEMKLPIEEIDRLFGTRKVSGAVRFLDALPLPGNAPYLELDVMNPHVARYYGGSDWPRPWDDPVPLCFPAVPAGTRFTLVVAAPEADDARTAMGLLVEGLGTLGAAAKRAAGYGWFEEADDGS